MNSPRRERISISTAASDKLSFSSTDRPPRQPTGPNPTMFPISEDGPFYAALLTGGNLDTKGGPKTSADGKVLDTSDRPIPGLYGVGNCVASASARAYWAGGATIGPILALCLTSRRMRPTRSR